MCKRMTQCEVGSQGHKVQPKHKGLPTWRVVRKQVGTGMFNLTRCIKQDGTNNHENDVGYTFGYTNKI